jgi:hypothetical protein
MPNKLGREAAQLAAAVEAACGPDKEKLFLVERTRRQHYLFFTADGTFICDLSFTPGSTHELTNKTSMLRRAGLDTTPKQARRKATR